MFWKDNARHNAKISSIIPILRDPRSRLCLDPIASDVFEHERTACASWVRVLLAGLYLDLVGVQYGQVEQSVLLRQLWGDLCPGGREALEWDTRSRGKVYSVSRRDFYWLLRLYD